MFTINLVRGDTYVFTGALSIDDVDQPIDGVTISSAVMAPDGSRAFPCVVQKLAPREDGKVYDYTVRGAPADTAEAPIGICASDIRYAWPDGRIDSTPVFYVNVTESPSRVVGALA